MRSVSAARRRMPAAVEMHRELMGSAGLPSGARVSSGALTQRVKVESVWWVGRAWPTPGLPGMTAVLAKSSGEPTASGSPSALLHSVSMRLHGLARQRLSSFGRARTHRTFPVDSLVVAE